MVEFVDKQTSFVANSVPVNTQTMADYLPSDPLFLGKNEDSNIRALLAAFSQELTRAEAKVQELADEEYPADTSNLIQQWERFVGIPDACFTIEGQTLEFRRMQVVAKLALMNATTTDDFVALADFFGILVEITSEVEIFEVFPYVFPFVFPSTIKEGKFTMVVTFPEIPPPSDVFPLLFPFTFSEGSIADFIICMFERIKPANVMIKVVFAG